MSKKRSRPAAAGNYDDDIGWARVDDFVSAARAQSVLARCEQMIEAAARDPRVGAKPHGGTRRLVDVVDRVPEAAQLVSDLDAVVTAIVDGPHALRDATYRCPHPGFGAQKLHADALPRLAAGPNLCATAIVPLVDFTGDNGATRVVPGSHHRPDLQRLSGNLDQTDGEITLTGPVGVAFVFTGHLLHSGTENRSSVPRPCLQFLFEATLR